MPITEMVILSFKQDLNTREAMQRIWPTASSVFRRTPAILSNLMGQMVLNNELSVRDSHKLVCLFGESNPVYILFHIFSANSSKEWESFEDFTSFLSSQEFKTFASQIGPFLSEPGKPQFFRTDLGVRHILGSPVTEILRLQADPHYSQDSAWERLIATIEILSGHSHRSIRGHSIILEEELWLGIVTWDNIEV